MKTLEINGDQDRVAHCVLQLGHSAAPDGAAIQSRDKPFHSHSQGIARAEVFFMVFHFGRKNLHGEKPKSISISVRCAHQKTQSEAEGGHALISTGA